MTTVLYMSTDQDIIRTRLSSSWNVTQTFSWNQVSQVETVPSASLGIAHGETIVVLAHGNNTEIGNADPGAVDITPIRFLILIQENMAANAEPDAVFVSTCSDSIAEFASRIRTEAYNAGLWGDAPIYGHGKSISGNVPAPDSIEWYEICATRLRRRRRGP